MAAPFILAMGTLLQGASSIASGMQQADALRAQASYNKFMGDFNARLDDAAAEDAITQGEEAVLALEEQGKKVRGGQRVAYAGQGVEADAGSAVDVAADTAAAIARDKVTIRNNAWRQSWGYKVEAFKQRTAGAYGLAAAENTARNTILTGGLKGFAEMTTGFGKLYSDFGYKGAK